MPRFFKKPSTLKILPFLFFLISFSSNAQQSKMDSLLATLPTEKDTTYILALQNIIPEFSNRDTQLYYAENSLEQSRKLDFLKGEAAALFRIGRLNKSKSNFTTAATIFTQLISIAKELQDTSLEFKTYIQMSETLLQSGKADESYLYLLEGIKVAEVSKKVAHQAEVFYKLGDFHRLQHNFQEAIDNFQKSLPLYEEAGMEGKYCWVRSCIAMTYKRFDSIEKKKEGIAIYEALLQDECGEIGSLWTRAKHYNNLGSAYVNIGDLKKGEEVLFKALAMKRQVNNKASLAYTLNEIATLYAEKGDFQNGLKYGEEAYSIIEPSNNIYLGYDVTRHLARAYYKTGNYKEGYEILQEFHELGDTILNKEKAAALVEMSSKYELEKKENDLVQKDLLLVQQENRFNRYLLTGLSILSVILILFLWARWRLQKQKIEAQKLQELDQLKTSFFTNITHEFRTPLTVILNSFPNDKNDRDEVVLNDREVNVIKRNAHRLNGLINQLLDLSKLEAGKMKLQVSQNDLSQYLKTLTQSFESLAAQKNIKLQFISMQSPFKAFFDVDKLEKTLINLLSNAIKFTEEGGEVDVLLFSKNRNAEIIVRDTGIGIAPDLLPKIFDRFLQADNSTTRNFEGSGIGLALVEQMVKVHQGTIKVESTLGEGTTFSIQLPVEKTAYNVNQIVKAEPISPKQDMVPLIIKDTPFENVSAATERKPLVLIIEDDPDLRYLIRNQLSPKYQILEAIDGEDGIKLALEKIPDLIISDVMMPNKSGYEVCKTIKIDERTNHIPLILLTAKATRDEKVEGLELGADDYLVKPFDKTELEVRINNLIVQRKKLQQRFSQEVVYKTKDSPIISREDAFIQKVLEIIEEKIALEGFGVEELAQAVHMSRSQLYRKLKALTNKTPNAFLREIRLSKAKALLQSDAGNVSEVAMMVGFSNANYFYKCFKEAYGITPGELLKSEMIK